MLSLVIAVCMAVSCAPSAALATGYGSCDSASTATISCVSQGSTSGHLSPTELGADCGQSSGELFAAYAERALYGSARHRQPLAKIGSSKLSGLPLKLYSALRRAAAEALGSFTSGYPDRLFLAGASSGSVEGGYSIALPEHVLPSGVRLRGSTVTYEYDNATKSLFGTGESSVLNLACEGYDPSAAPAGGEGGDGGASSAAGQLAPGDSFKAGGVTYEVTAAGKVRVTKVSGSRKTVTVPAMMKVQGVTLKVTGIAPKALKSCKATTLLVKTKLLTKKGIANALKGSKVTTVKVQVSSSAKTNKAYAAKYKKIFTSSICGKKVTVKN